MAMQNLSDLFHHELRDIYSAEKQLVKAIPKLVAKATNEDLKKALQVHLKETENQVARLECVFDAVDKTARSKTCEAMKGLIEEAESMIKEKATVEVTDAAIIACAQKIEHYEIATYKTLCTWSDLLGYHDALTLLKQTLEEEESTDKTLTQLSRSINQHANT